MEEARKLNVQTTCLTQSFGKEVILQTLMVKSVGPSGKEKLVRALIDSGSQRSYVFKKTIGGIELEPKGQETVIHSLFGGSATEPVHHKSYLMKAKSTNGWNQVYLNVLDQNMICEKIPRASFGPWTAELRKKNIWVSDLGKGNPDIEILIGADEYGKLLTGHTHQLSNGLTAVETRLGWTLMGRWASDEISMGMLVSSLIVNDSSVAALWKLETIGIMDTAEKQTKEEEDILTKQHFLNTVRQNEDGRYVVRLPWLDDHQRIPSNKSIAEKRLVNTTHKLNSLGKYKEYEEVFNQWLLESIIEEVPLAELNIQTHYLPHRPVLKPESTTTPIRPVFDASYKSGRFPFLNNCLVKGPNHIELIPSLILRFRENKVGVIADIRKAFLMVEVDRRDRDFLRFLWWEDWENKIFKIYRHARVVFGVTSSPFLLAAVIEYHLQSENHSPEGTEKLLKSLYVDNCVTSLSSRQALQVFREKSTEIMAEAKMELRPWKYSHDEESKGDNRVSSILGLKWDRDCDTLSVEIDFLPELKVITKKIVLSCA